MVGVSFAGSREPIRKGAAARSRPRYFVTIWLTGGIDAVWTVDPKRLTDVEPWVDVPYPGWQIVEAGNLRFGPLFAPLARWTRNLTVLQGVQVGVANHYSGAHQVVRMRTRCQPRMPGILDIIGSRNDGQPLACLKLGGGERTPGDFYDSPDFELLSRIDKASDEELLLMADVLKKEAARLPRRTGASADRTRENLEQASALFERVTTCKRFSPSYDPSNPPGYQPPLERCLWALENDLTSSVFITLPDWDSHADNTLRQAEMTTNFVAALEVFLTQLHQRSNAHGTLAEQTALVITSELGRYPGLNSVMGKDHFPQAPMVLMGPHFNSQGDGGAAYGGTGRSMEGLRVSMKTGLPDSRGQLLRLDDVGATLLHVAGIDPLIHGYTGQILDFLVS